MSGKVIHGAWLVVVAENLTLVSTCGCHCLPGWLAVAVKSPDGQVASYEINDNYEEVGAFLKRISFSHARFVVPDGYHAFALNDRVVRNSQMMRDIPHGATLTVVRGPAPYSFSVVPRGRDAAPVRGTAASIRVFRELKRAQGECQLPSLCGRPHGSLSQFGPTLRASI